MWVSTAALVVMPVLVSRRSSVLVMLVLVMPVLVMPVLVVPVLVMPVLVDLSQL